MFFATRLVLVEGVEDVAYITTYLNLLDKWDDYRQTGCHIVPVNGKSQLLQPLVIAKGMRIPTFVVFDADSDEPDAERRIQHDKDNRALLVLLGKTVENTMPTVPLWGSGFVMWHSNIGSIVRDDIGAAAWSASEAEADKQFGHAGNLKKNALHIGAALNKAWDDGKTSPSLERLCAEILNLGNSVQ
jgi:putative ATP-dependent endonuclease of the OLD family